VTVGADGPMAWYSKIAESSNAVFEEHVAGGGAGHAEQDDEEEHGQVGAPFDGSPNAAISVRIQVC